MKTTSIIITMGLGLLFGTSVLALGSSAPAPAAPAPAAPAPMKLQVVALDPHNSRAVSSIRIIEGKDAFLVTLTTSREVSGVKPVAVFKGSDNKMYEAVTNDDLKQIDVKKDKVVTKAEQAKMGTPLFIATITDKNNLNVRTTPLEKVQYGKTILATEANGKQVMGRQISFILPKRNLNSPQQPQ